MDNSRREKSSSENGALSLGNGIDQDKKSTIGLRSSGRRIMDHRGAIEIMEPMELQKQMESK